MVSPLAESRIFGVMERRFIVARMARCWYASEEFSSERVVGGWGTVEVIGGFELRRLHSDQILDPAPG
jgi:hypothetical protein